MAVTPPCRRRWRLALRRLFFFALMVGLTAPAALTQTGAGKSARPARLEQRRLRVGRDAQGDLLFIESLRVRLPGSEGDTIVLEEPLPLVRLPERAREVRPVGGDLPPEQILIDPPRIAALAPMPVTFQVAFAYLLPADVESVELVAEAPVDELVVEIPKGSVEARPDPRLEAAGEGGSEARPYRTYRASGIPADSAIVLRLPRRKVDGRQRFAVLVATLLAATVAGVYVWRSGRRSSGP